MVESLRASTNLHSWPARPGHSIRAYTILPILFWGRLGKIPILFWGSLGKLYATKPYSND